METSSNPKPPSGRKSNTLEAIDAPLDAWQKWKKATYALLLPSLEVVFWEDVLHGVKVGGTAERFGCTAEEGACEGDWEDSS